MNVGERLKQLRLAKGLTLEEVGALIGVQKAAVQKYENGTVKNLKRSTIEKLAEVFNVSPLYIMGWEEKEQRRTPQISNNLNFLIKINRFSLDYVVKETGISKKDLEDIISGKDDGLSLPGKKMMKLADLFGMEFDELYGQLPSRIYENFTPYPEDVLEVANAYAQSPSYYKNSVRRILGLSDLHEEDVSEDVKHA